CEYPVSKEINEDLVQKITQFLNGGHHEIKKELANKMTQYAEQLEFEKAKEYRDLIQHIEAVMEKQKMVMQDSTNRDVFGYHFDKGWMCVQVFFIRQGKLIERDVSLFPFYNDPKEAFVSYVARFY